MRVAEHSSVQPLLPDHEPAAAERTRSRKPGVRECRLNTLNLVEVRLVGEELVDLHRHPGAARALDAEQRTDTRREEEEHLFALGIELSDACPDLVGVKRPEHVRDDGRGRILPEEYVDSVHACLLQGVQWRRPDERE